MFKKMAGDRYRNPVTDTEDQTSLSLKCMKRQVRDSNGSLGFVGKGEKETVYLVTR